MRFALLLLVLVPGSSWAQAQNDARTNADNPTIVVTGRKVVPVKQAEHFVRQVVATDLGQLARFLEPVCPLVLGAPVAKAEAITDRIRRVAAATHVRLAPQKCEPNLVAVIASNGDGLIRTMRKRHASFFNDLSDADLRDAFRPGKVHSWRLIEERDEDGAPISGAAEVHSSSVFDLPRQAATVNAVIVLDKNVVLDKTIAQIADYITMRALAGARPPKEGDAAQTTILSLFEAGAAPPKELSSMDEGLLQGLYAIDGTGDAMRQVHQISRKMVSNAAPNRPKSK